MTSLKTTRPTRPTRSGRTPEAAAPPSPSVGRGRRLGIVAIALVIAGLFALPTLPSLVTAWSSADLDGAHRIHLLAQGLHGVVILLPAVALLRDRWRSPAAVQLLVVLILLVIAVAVPFGLVPSPAAVVPPVLLVGALIALLPDRRSLLTVRPSAVLLALAAAGSIGLAVYAADQLQLQHALPHTEPHAAVHHWAGMGLFAVTLAGMAIVAALRAAGWRLALWGTGSVAALFGAVSVLSPRYPSSLGAVWGMVTIAGAIAFLAAGEAEHRRAQG